MCRSLYGGPPHQLLLLGVVAFLHLLISTLRTCYKSLLNPNAKFQNFNFSQETIRIQSPQGYLEYHSIRGGGGVWKWRFPSHSRGTAQQHDHLSSPRPRILDIANDHTDERRCPPLLHATGGGEGVEMNEK